MQMHVVPANDDKLTALSGQDIHSTTLAGVAYRIGPRLGQGALANVFVAMRIAADGVCPVVLKIVRPSCAMALGSKAGLSVKRTTLEASTGERISMQRGSSCTKPVSGSSRSGAIRC